MYLFAILQDFGFCSKSNLLHLWKVICMICRLLISTVFSVLEINFLPFILAVKIHLTRTYVTNEGVGFHWLWRVLKRKYYLIDHYFLYAIAKYFSKILFKKKWQTYCSLHENVIHKMQKSWIWTWMRTAQSTPRMFTIAGPVQLRCIYIYIRNLRETDGVFNKQSILWPRLERGSYSLYYKNTEVLWNFLRKKASSVRK